MNLLDTLDIASWLRLKHRGHFVIEKAGRGYLLTVHRPGEPEETIRCASAGEANRRRQVLSDAGLAGYVEGGL